MRRSDRRIRFPVDLSWRLLDALVRGGAISGSRSLDPSRQAEEALLEAGIPPEHWVEALGHEPGLPPFLPAGAGLPSLHARTETFGDKTAAPPRKPANAALPDVPVALPQPTAPAHPDAPKIEAKKEEPEEEGDVRLQVVFDDIQRLQEAARRQGGRLVVSFTPVGISTEDLLSELKRDGYFALAYRKGGTVEVYSPDLGAQKRKLADEIEELRRRRNELLHDDKALKGYVDGSPSAPVQSEGTTLGNFDPSKAVRSPVAEASGEFK